MFRRISVLTATWLVLLGLLAGGTASAQENDTDDDVAVEPSYYGDTELIETLRTYGFLDDWVQASPVSAQASLLLVAGSGGYQTQRQTFLDSIASWASRTEQVRATVTRIDTAQAHADRLRSAINQVLDALVLDDRLAVDSVTLAAIDDALLQLGVLEIPTHIPGESEDPIVLAEIQLHELWELATTEIVALNGAEPAAISNGIGAFVGFQDLEAALNEVDQLINRARQAVEPAREQSEGLVASALDQIPSLHQARMVGSSDVDGLSIVTVDAYIRAAQRSGCSVDWTLLAGIGKIESNHGRIGGASVSRSGQVSTVILGPLLDGGQSEQGEGEASQVDERWEAIAELVEATRLAARTTFERSLWSILRDDTVEGAEPGDQGNGFAVVVDSDDGRLDGNAEWDRAIGPMQFLPETWSKWATDGNGDGVADPHNLYDAAASAGRFLCDLAATRGPSPSTFVLGYNSSTSYVRDVLSAAQALQSAALPEP